jgi:hypothetical protein
MKKLFLILAVFLMVGLMFGAQKTNNGSAITASTSPDFGVFHRYTITTGATGDTTTLTIPNEYGTSMDSVGLWVKTFSDGNPCIRVRYMSSMDNVAWKSYTIGTDSTTWGATAATSAAATLQYIPLGFSRGYVPAAYNKLVIWHTNLGANTANSSMELYLIRPKITK